MNRTASTRAFALNPCPADPLGRQMVYMHMSSHYRRMYSAQSVVDSAAPSKRRQPKTATGGTTNITGHTFNALVPTLKQGVASKNNVRYFPFSSAPPIKPLRKRPAIVSEHPDALLSLNLPLVGSQRPILSVGSASAPSPIPRGSTSPRSCQTSPRNARVNTSDTGRNFRSRQSMRGDEGYTGVKPLPRSKLRERPGTYLAKLDQLANGSMNVGPIQTAEENSPFKPRILPSNVQSKLRNSSVYHPPRPRATNRSKLEVRSKDGKQSSETPRSNVQSSPPGSSRDSAYNGGVSSGGESHLRARELEIKKQKRRAWTSGLQPSVTSDDLRPLGTPEGTIGDGGLVGSPAYSCFSSIVSSHGGTSDVGTNADNREHSGSFNEDIESQIDGGSHLDGTSAFEDESHYGNESPVEEIHVDVASQMEASCNSFEEDEEPSRSPTSDVSTEFASKKNVVDQMVQVEDFLISAKQCAVYTSANATTSMGSLLQSTSVATSATIVEETKAREVKSVGTVTNDKSVVDLPENSRWSDPAYVRLVNAFTSDAIKRGVLTNKALKAIYDEHVEANKHALNMERMLEEWDKLCLDLNIPKEEHEQTANYGLGSVIRNRSEHLSPLTSQPSETWNETTSQLPRTSLLRPHSCADVATAMSAQLDEFEAEFNTIKPDSCKVFDPIGIMGSPGYPEKRSVPKCTSPPYTQIDPVAKSIQQDPVPRSVEQTSSPIREPVHQKVSKESRCVCGKVVCSTCTSADILLHMTKWLQSSQARLDKATRRHSIPESRKALENTSKNFRTHTPPVERARPISEIRNNDPPNLQPPKNIVLDPVPVPSPEHQPKTSSPRQEKKTVRPRDTHQNRTKEKMVVCLYDHQQTFSSNDSVNVGIFGRNESEIMSLQADFNTVSYTIPNEVPDFPVTAKTQDAISRPNVDPLLDSPELNFSLGVSTCTPSPNSEFDKTMAYFEKEHSKLLKWLGSN